MRKFLIILLLFTNYSFANNDLILQKLDLLLNIPYRNDGVQDLQGKNTLFANQQIEFKETGFNCSGWTLQAFRNITNQQISIEESKFDILNNSQQHSLKGEDWDFGLDFILNISKNNKRKLLIPQQEISFDFVNIDDEKHSFDIHNKTQRQELLKRLQNNKIYLLDFIKFNNKQTMKYKVLHYHTALIYKENDNIWFYNTTHQAKNSYKINLNKQEDLQRFIKSFSNSKQSSKKLLVLEIDL